MARACGRNGNVSHKPYDHRRSIGCVSDYRAYQPRQTWVLMLLPTTKRVWRCILTRWICVKMRRTRRSRVEFDVRPPKDYFPRMSSTADKLEKEIKALPDIEKLRLVDAILTDLDRPDPEIDRIWAEEARKRWDATKPVASGPFPIKRSCPNTETNENSIPRGSANR